MDIELLNATGQVLARLKNVRNPEVGFNTTWKDQFNATSWRGYVPPLPAAQTLSDAISDALAKIDVAAGQARLRYLTASPGQEATYQEKYQDAANFVAAGYPADLTPYPWVSAEANATGKTPHDAADTIIATKALWVTKGALIEGARIKGKTDVRAAVNIGDVITARNTTIISLSAI